MHLGTGEQYTEHCKLTYNLMKETTDHSTEYNYEVLLYLVHTHIL